jgi:hypothetical protein
MLSHNPIVCTANCEGFGQNKIYVKNANTTHTDIPFVFDRWSLIAIEVSGKEIERVFTIIQPS